MTPPTIIVLSDSSSDEEEKPCAGGLVGSSVYRDALASALAMVSSLDGAPAVHETVVAEPQQKTKKKQVNSFDRRVHEEELRALGVRAGASTQTKLASRKSVPLEARRPMAERQLPFTNKRTPVVSLSSSSSSSSSDSSSGPESRVLTPRVRARSSSKAPLHKRLRRFDEQQVRSRPDAGIRTEPTPPRIAEPPARPLNVVSPPSPRKNAAVQPHRPPSKKTNKTSSSDSLTAHVHGFRATKRMCRKSVVPAPMVQSASPSSEETTPVRRPRRQLESFFNTDAIAFEDIQAQEAELARLRFEKALLDAIAEDHRREEQHDTGDHATSRVDLSVTVDLCSSSDESDSSMDTADTKSVRSDREHPETAHVVSTTPAESTPVPVALSRVSPVPVPSERRSFVPSSNKKKEDSAPKRSERSRQEVSQTKTRVRNVLSIKPPSRSQEFAFLEPRSRTKYQADIPINILSINPRPFSAMAELPLSTFDESGELEQKCVFRASFGRSGPLSTSTLFFESTDDRDKKRSQEHVNYQVRQAIESELPVIRDCYKRRSRAVLSESRMRTLRYIQARNSCRQDQVHVACDANGSMTRRIDDAHAALRSRPVSSPVYIMGQGEVHVRESRIGLLGRVTSLVAIPSISRSTTCVTVKTNARVEDDPILRYTPSSAVEAEVPDAVSASNSLMEYESQSKWKLAAAAVDDEVTEFMLRLVVNECGDSEQVFQALKTVAGLTQPYTDYCALKKMYDSRRVAQRRLADALSLVQLHAHEELKDAALGTINLLASSHLLKSYEEKTLRELLSAPVSSFDAHTVRECLDGDDTKFGLRRTDEYPDLVESYRDLFCRMCYRYDCQEHGIEQPLPSRRVDPSYPSAKDVRVSSGSRVDPTEYLDHSHVHMLTEKMTELLMSTGPCSNECWKTKPLSGTAAHDVLRRNSRTTRVLLQKLSRILGTNGCLLTAVVKVIPCNQIQVVLEDIRRQAGRRDEWHEDRVNSIKRSRKQGRTKISSNRELLTRTLRQRLVDNGANHAYEPCNHDGLCDSTACSCIKRDHMCDRACSCTRDCPNRFQGCRCSLGECRAPTCPCFQAGRECDPDLCRTCGASTIAVKSHSKDVYWYTNSGHERDNGIKWLRADRTERHTTWSVEDGASSGDLLAPVCSNLNLLRLSHKKISVAKSTVHGWGAFAMEPIKMGEFVYEYTGELLSQDEAERRGALYDRMTVSYLFDLNEDAVVDAIRKGNKSRFINHAPSRTHENCQAKVIRTGGGEHRISLWATRDIRPGEELFFNYGYRSASAPGWSQNQVRSGSTG